MKTLRVLVAALVASSSAGVVFSSSVLLVNCATVTPVVAEGAYTAELVACEQDASSRAAAIPCRCGVDQKFGVDGGNCQ